METASGKLGLRRPLRTTKERPWLRVGSRIWKGTPRRVFTPTGRFLRPFFSWRSSTPAASSKDSAGPILAALERSRKRVWAEAFETAKTFTPEAKRQRERKIPSRYFPQRLCGESSCQRPMKLGFFVFVILGDDLDDFLGFVDQMENVHVLLVDVLLFTQDRLLDPIQASAPALLAHQDHGTGFDLVGLDQGQGLEELVQGPETARQDHHGRGVTQEHHLADEEVMEVH